MNWSFGASWPSLLIGIAATLLAGWICISNWRRSGRRPAIARLEVLRFLLILLLLFTLLRPEVVRTIERTEKPEIAVLVDRSGSMVTRDLLEGTNIISRQAWISNQLERAFWKPLEKNARIVRSTFPDPGTNSVPANGTDLNAAMQSLVDRRENLKAVLLLTDGDWNVGKSPLSAATQLRESGVPVYSVVTGREQPLPDLALETVTPPAYGLFGEQITIPFVIRNHLASEVKTVVTLFNQNKEESKREVLIPARGQVQETIHWYPRVVGEAALSLQVPVQEGELIPENNQQAFRINIRVETLKVLVVDSLPRWEYRFLRNALARDPGVEVNSILFHPGMRPGAGKNYLSAFPNTKEAISRYDVIFLGDVGLGEGELETTDLDLIKGLVEQQASGLVFVAGRRGRHHSLLDSPLRELLPVTFEPGKPAGTPLLNESVLTLTSLGKGHLLTRFESEENLNAQIWQNLPGFYWSAGVEKSRPGSEVLAVHSSLRNASGRLPMLVTRSAGAGKVLFLGTDSAWRWRRGVEDKYHYRFWSQVVRWMAHKRHLSEKEGIRLTYTPERPEPNETVFLQTTVLDQAGFPAEEGPVTATITSPSGRAEQLQFAEVEGGWGVFKSSFTPEENGAYKFSLEAPRSTRKLETELMVQSPLIEKIGQPANAGILREIATVTQAATAPVERFDDLIQQIALTPEPKPLERRLRLWSSPGWAGLLLGMLTLYWIGRKLAGLL